MTRVRRIALACTAIAALPVGACASFDPAVPYRLPDADWALGVSLATAWDEAETPITGGPLVGIDGSYLDDVFGLHAGVRVHHEGRGERVSGLVEATVWYVLLFGMGVRAGGLVNDAGLRTDAEGGTEGLDVPRVAVDLTFLVALPIPLWKDCNGRIGALVLAPYARPGFRMTGNDPGPDDIRGFHEVGLSLRWTSFAF